MGQARRRRLAASSASSSVPFRSSLPLAAPSVVAAHALVDGLRAYRAGPDGQVDVQAAMAALSGLYSSGAVKLTEGQDGQPKVEIGALVHGTMVVMTKLLDELCRVGDLDRDEVLFDLHGYVDAPHH